MLHTIERSRVTGLPARADVLVGIPAFNNARTIAHVVRTVRAGLTAFLGGRQGVILVSDAHSRDDTPRLLRDLVSDDQPPVLVFDALSAVPGHRLARRSLSGDAAALRSIFRAADALRVRACAVVDAGLRTVTPEWIPLLVRPVLEGGFDHVAPRYLRHKYDDTLTTGIVYPLTRALYGQRLRQPMGGALALSGRLAAHYLSTPGWDRGVDRYAIDTWMTTTAICDRFSIAQSFLGLKIEDRRQRTADLGEVLAQALGTMFALMETNEGAWMRTDMSSEVPLVGADFAAGVGPVAVDRTRMIDRFRAGVANLERVWAAAINDADLSELVRLARVSPDRFRIDAGVWARVVYDLACAFHHRVIDRAHLVRSALPLYFGWVASFVASVATGTGSEAEAAVEDLCVAFEARKSYLRRRWSGDARPVAAGTPEMAFVSSAAGVHA